VFCAGDGWTRYFPMNKEREAHEAISLIFNRGGVPNVVVMDGAKAQVQYEFRRKLHDHGCHIKQTEPYTASYNMGEGEVRELKQGFGRKTLCSDVPRIIGVAAMRGNHIYGPILHLISLD
jgi:hypothetical protein